MITLALTRAGSDLLVDVFSFCARLLLDCPSSGGLFASLGTYTLHFSLRTLLDGRLSTDVGGRRRKVSTSKTDVVLRNTSQCSTDNRLKDV